MDHIIRLSIKTKSLSGETTSIVIPDEFLEYVNISGKCTFLAGEVIPDYWSTPKNTPGNTPIELRKKGIWRKLMKTDEIY